MTGFDNWKWALREREELRPITGSAERLGKKNDRVKESYAAGSGHPNRRWELSAPQVIACLLQGR